MKWYVVPNETSEQSAAPLHKRPATVVNEYGAQVAEFEMLQDAEQAVEAFNGRAQTSGGVVSLAARET